jgi:hypothetical protein
MSRCVLQYVFKANPGSDMGKVMAQVKTAAALWKKHGGEVSFWAVAGGEVGNSVFTVMFPSFAAYGKCADALYTDPEFQAWNAQGVASGLTSWVRSNVAREIILQ